MNNFRLTTFVDKTSQNTTNNSNLNLSLPACGAERSPDLVKMESELISFYNLEVNHVQSTHDIFANDVNIDNYRSKNIFNSNIYKQDQLLPLLLINLIKNHFIQKIKIERLTIIAKIFLLFSLPSPYELREGVRFLRGSSNLVPDKLKIIAIDENNNNLKFGK